jgi:hypothetical protein
LYIGTIIFDKEKNKTMKDFSNKFGDLILNDIDKEIFNKFCEIIIKKYI